MTSSALFYISYSVKLVTVIGALVSLYTSVLTNEKYSLSILIGEGFLAALTAVRNRA